MFFDEEMILDLRLNILNEYVDKFVITEATYLHSGKPKKLFFDINKFPKFKDKIIYNVVENQPPNLEEIYEGKDDKTGRRGEKLINNSSKREHYQREMAQGSIEKADPDDLILINDVDEIPNLEGLNFNKIKEKLIIFKQKMFFYKFNLVHENLYWYGSRVCKKKYFITPQWLRDTKHKKYPFWRLDTIFSKMKYRSIHYVKNGGWHFTNIKSPKDIEWKYSNFLHHQDFEYSGLKLKDVEDMVKNKKVLYDHNVDQRNYKWSGITTLKNVSISELPDYLNKNKEKYSEWLDV